MRTILAPLLLSYFAIYVFAAFVWRSYRTWRQTGINPYALGRTDNAHDFIGKLFRAALATILATVLLYAFLPSVYTYLMPVEWLQHPQIVLAGIILLFASLLWIIVAQAQMGASWRIGIDSEHATQLVQHGVFRWSRNPIFLGMRLTLFGLFLVLPSAATFALLLVSEALIQIQVRLEEEHLLRLHGASYRNYQERTRRWL